MGIEYWPVGYATIFQRAQCKMTRVASDSLSLDRRISGGSTTLPVYAFVSCIYKLFLWNKLLNTYVLNDRCATTINKRFNSVPSVIDLRVSKVTKIFQVRNKDTNSFGRFLTSPLLANPLIVAL
jgi:hypothetical protein